MYVIPSIDISEGHAVKRVRGAKGTGIVLGDPKRVAENIYNEGYRWVHVVDLDAAEGNGDNLEVIGEIIKMGFERVQVGGGVRDKGRAISLLRAGAFAVIISSLFFIEPERGKQLLKEIGEDKVMASLDYDNNFIRVKGWRKEVLPIQEGLEMARSLNVKGYILTYISNEGTGKGIDPSLAHKIKYLNGLLEYAGGIGGLEDLFKLKDTGINGAIVGNAYYSGRIRGVSAV